MQSVAELATYIMHPTSSVNHHSVLSRPAWRGHDVLSRWPTQQDRILYARSANGGGTILERTGGNVATNGKKRREWAMQLAKPAIDLGLLTNNTGPMMQFWTEEAGFRLDHALPIQPGHEQHRLDASGSLIKINVLQAPLPDAPHSGYRELIVARAGVDSVRALIDPDGNHVTVVPPGYDGNRGSLLSGNQQWGCRAQSRLESAPGDDAAYCLGATSDRHA